MHFVLINGRKFSWESNLTIFQFCFSKGVNIPCFCYHERLSIAGIVGCV